MKLRSFCTAKEIIKTLKGNLKNEKIFANLVYGMRLITKTYKKLIELDSKKI